MYISGPNKFDGVSGFPVGSTQSVDFCYSPDYQIAGEIDLYGYLHASAGKSSQIVLLSPYYENVLNSYTMTMYYHLPEDVQATSVNKLSNEAIGRIELISADGNQLSAMEVYADQTSATLPIPQSPGCRVSFALYPGKEIVIEKIIYETNYVFSF